MITALLPTMTSTGSQKKYSSRRGGRNTPSPPVASTVDNLEASRPSPATNRSAGIVGFSTGLGALLALLVFLRLPDVFQRAGASPEKAIAESYYIVGAVAIALSFICIFGLKGMQRKRDEKLKGKSVPRRNMARVLIHRSQNLVTAAALGFQNGSIGVAYVGGLVARASSVGITLFIPLLVNAYFISTGRCDDSASNPVEIKDKCREAYVLAAELTGVSQLVGLFAAPCFGFLAEKYKRFNICLLAAALAGTVGYLTLSALPSPEFKGPDGSPWVFVIMALIGISQIGAIVCSLGLLGRSVLETQITDQEEDHTSLPEEDAEDARESSQDGQHQEIASLLSRPAEAHNLEHLKGSIAGVYSFCGGVGILFLTKVGGALFDRQPATPFYIMAAFNGVLLLAGILVGVLDLQRTRGLHY